METSSDPNAEQIRRPPPGIVKPPRDIQAIVEKTAGYVHRNGKIFENRIRDKEKSNPKFSFLNLEDAYAPFYEWRLQEISEGRGTAVSAGRTTETEAAYASPKNEGPKRPPDFTFSARMPNISAQDLDVVRLTALFVAKHGKTFMTTLVQKENRNFQFDFLRPQHSLHQFFSRLVDQYIILLQGPSEDARKVSWNRREDLRQRIGDKFGMLDRSRRRAEWIRYQEEQKTQKEEAAQKEQVEYAQIDWHDFVVVEEVLFEEADEQAILPAPTSLNDLQTASLEQKAAMSLQPHDRRIEEAMPSEQDDVSLENNHFRPEVTSHSNPISLTDIDTSTVALNQDLSSAHVPQGSSNILAMTSRQESGEDRVGEEEQAYMVQAAARENTIPPMRIRENHVPQAQAKRQNVQTAICPNCKQAIPLDELDRHMKIELLDPRWKEQKQKADSRTMATNLSTSEVAANLKRLASQRSDVFDGVTSQPLVTAEEEARRKRAALHVYDGNLDQNMGSANAAARKAMASAEAERQRDQARDRGKGGSIEEQIRWIHQKAKG